MALSPLMGIKLRLDLIQAFATAFGVEKLIALIREQGLKGKAAVDDGRDGAYLGAQLDMVLEGALNLSFKYASNEEREMEFQLGIASGVRWRLGRKRIFRRVLNIIW